MYFQPNSPFYLRGDEVGGNGSRFSDLGELEQAASNVFHHQYAVNLNTSTTTTATGSSYNNMKSSNVSIVSNDMHFGGLNNSSGSGEIGGGGGAETGQLMVNRGGRVVVSGNGGGALGNGHFEKWRESVVVADHSQTTDTSTYTDDKTQFPGAHQERLIDVDSTDRSKGRIGEQKALRRLAQNREAARKSRMRKKAYVHQLESSRLKLAQLEQELKRVKQQNMYASGHHIHTTGGNGVASAFAIEYAQWLDEDQQLINDLRAALNSHMSDSEMRLLVEGVMSHYDEIFRLKMAGAKSDIFHMLFGMWKTPVERCFLWLGGFRPSQILKILGNQIVPLTEQQLVGICNLQQSSQQAEDALSQGMEALQQALVEILSSNSLAPHRNSAASNVADYMGLMAIAMAKLATLENFLYQADLLRQQTLQQLQRILTTRQTARALIAITDHRTRLRTLSSLWLARPKE